jgi:hydroxyacylglutathione hydrolase
VQTHPPGDLQTFDHIPGDRHHVGMKNVARNVWQVPLLPPNAINAYLAEDVLIDCGTRFDRRRILKQLNGVSPRLIALTHVHPDHQGAAHALCEHFQCPLVCHEADRPVMQGARPMRPATWQIRLSSRLCAGPPHPVERTLREGDEIAGFRVIESPGHTPGHVYFFREEDRVAIVGDVATNMNLLTTIPGLHEPPGFFCHDVKENRQSIRKLANLRPATVLFGHGPPLRDPDRLLRFADSLA